MPQTITLTQLRKTAASSRKRFKKGDRVVFLCSDLYSLTGTIRKVTKDALWTFGVLIEHPDLAENFEHKMYSYDEKKKEFVAWVPGDCLALISDIPNPERINRNLGPDRERVPTDITWIKVFESEIEYYQSLYDKYKKDYYLEGVNDLRKEVEKLKSGL